jgi:heme-degrading monooxygenase HmoA
MIRVIYRWRVKPGKEEMFRHAWEKGTIAMRRTFKGAHGSLLLQSQKLSSEFTAIAKWDNEPDLLAARKSSLWPPDPDATHSVHLAAGRTISTEIFEEINDLAAGSQHGM